MQYVRKTFQELNKRESWHKSEFRHPSKYVHCRVLSNFFNKGMSKEASLKVQMTDEVEGNKRTNTETMDPSITQIRKRIETNRIRTLRTAYPNGLNDQIRMTTEKTKLYS